MPNFIRLKQLNQSEISGFFVDSTTTLTSGITKSIVNDIVTNQIVLTTGSQNISGIKNFGSKPTVNNIPVVLFNELSAGQDLNNFVLRTGDQTVSGHKVFLSGITSLNIIYNTGNQIVSGEKTFINNQNFSSNINVSGTGTFNAIDLNNIDNLSFSGVDTTITNGNLLLTGGTVNINSANPMNIIDPININGNVVITGNLSVSQDFTVGNKKVTDRSFGPYVLNRNTSTLFDASNYLPSRNGVALSSLSLTASAGDINTPNTLGYYGMFNFLSTTAEGIFPGFVNPFNPFRVFGSGSQYRINAYVYATNILNDGLHCMLRSVTNDGNNNLTETTIRWSNGAIEFGGGPGSSSRVYLAESQLITASSDQFINYKLYLGAYAGSNNGLVRDVVLYFYRDV